MVWSQNDAVTWYPSERAGWLFNRIATWRTERRAAVYAEVVNSSGGSIPITSKTILDPEVDPTNQLDSLNRRVLETARESWLHSTPLLRSFKTEFDASVVIYFEPITAPLRLIIVGAGHVGRAVGQLAKLLGYHLVVLDERPDYCNPAWFGQADEMVVGEFQATIQRIPADSDTFWLVMTSGHSSDGECLAACLRKPHAYIGLLSSPRKKQQLYERLTSWGIPEHALAAVHTPVGIPIGSKSPEEIAVSIIAEIIKVKNRVRTLPRSSDEVL